MGALDQVPTPKMLFEEGSAPSTPSAGEVALYAKDDGLLYSKDDEGTETAVSGGGGSGDVATDAIWDAAGDLAVGSGANAAARLAAGSENDFLMIASGVPAWAVPGYQSWTPALTATSVNPTLGSGSTAAGRYVRIGDMVICHGVIVFGSSGVGAGTGNYRVSLPVAMRATLAANEVVGFGHIRDDGGSASKGVLLRAVTTTTCGLMTMDAGATVQAGAPWAWAAGDEIDYVCWYEAG